MKKKEQTAAGCATQLRSRPEGAFLLGQGQTPLGGEAQMYRAMREAVPILDAAIGKLVRLTGGFTAACADKQAERELRKFLLTAPIGRGQYGVECFLEAYLDSLLTYGRAIGEMVVSQGKLVAVCWGDVTRVHVQQPDSPLELTLGTYEKGQFRAFPQQKLLLFSTWNPDAENPYGASLLRSMPFLTDVLMKIYKTIGINWERAGNVRYSVVYRPKDERAESSAAAEQMAREWTAAMQDGRSGAVRDFVAVGDVEIKVIGADGKILDSETPVRQILEQLVAKTGLPPFMLGLSWASTERMSKQQADLLTSELWAIRRCVQPVLQRICGMWLRLNGYGCEAEIVWDDISLQDIVEEAHAELYRQQAEKIKRETEETR